MPVTKPAVSGLKATPSTTDAVSPESTVGGMALPKMVHGHAGGEASGVTGFDGADAGPVPMALVAATRNVYVVPFVRPVTVADTDEPGAVIDGLAVDPMYGVTV